MAAQIVNTIKRLELVTRQEHIDPSGGEIKRTFYVEPYSAAKLVALILLGDVVQHETLLTKNRRILPVNDKTRSFFFANEVYIDPLDIQQFSFADHIRLAPMRDALHEHIYNAIVNYDETTLFANVNGERIENIHDTPGALITAIFRPAISLHIPSDWNDSNDVSKIFDWLDPQFTFETELHSFTKGVFLNIPSWLPSEKVKIQWWNPFRWPAVIGKIAPTEPRVRADDTGVAFKVPDNVTGFTIRRALVPRVPWRTISALAYSINKHPFRCPNGLQFPEGTVRFDGVKIYSRYTPSQKIAFDIEYHFSVRSTWGTYWVWEGETPWDYSARYGPVPWGYGLAYPDTYQPGSLNKWGFGWYEITFDPKRSMLYPGGHDVTKMYKTDEHAGRQAGIGENVRLDTKLFDLTAE